MRADLLQAINQLRADRGTGLYFRALDSDAEALFVSDTQQHGASDLLAAAWAQQAEVLTAMQNSDVAHCLDITPFGKVFIQSFVPPRSLILIGAVHIAQALVPMASALDFQVRVIDPRAPFANPQRFPGVRLDCAWPDEVLGPDDFDAQTALCLLSHDPKIDDPALVLALNAPRSPAYIGALGSKKTSAKRIARLSALGLRHAQIDRIHAPIGLDIASKTPAEIAVSIAAEIIAVMRSS